MKTSKVFKAAKAQLWDGEGDWCRTDKEKFICIAIWGTPNIRDGDKIKARRIVENLLGGHDTLEGWLSATHQIKAYNDRPKIQQTRRAWLDHLINHYESIGA